MLGIESRDIICVLSHHLCVVPLYIYICIHIHIYIYIYVYIYIISVLCHHLCVERALGGHSVELVMSISKRRQKACAQIVFAGAVHLLHLVHHSVLVSCLDYLKVGILSQSQHLGP